MDNNLKDEIPDSQFLEDSKCCDYFVISTFENQFLFTPISEELIKDRHIILKPKNTVSRLKVLARLKTVAQ